MNKNIYIGTRIEHREMNELVGTSISRLNEGLSKNLRSSVMNKGIKKTEQGQKLHFYLVDEVQYQKLISETDIVLVRVDGDELGRKLQEVNSRYPRRMDYGTSMKYKFELEREFENSVEVVGKDKNIRNKPTKSDYLSGNSKLGKLIYNTDGYNWDLGEVGEFFDYLFHKEYVKGFSYSNPSQGMKSEDDKSLEYYTWDTTSSPNHEILKEYQNCYRFLIQWSDGDKYSKVYLSDFNGTYLCSQSWYDDGYRYRTQIETSQPLIELYDEFKKQYNPLDFTDSLMFCYSPYGYWKFFEGYEPITWDECRETYEKIFVPIIKETEGEDELGYDTLNRERMRDILLSNRGMDWIELEHGLWIKKYILNEDVTREDIVDIWWNNKKSDILYVNPKTSKSKLNKIKDEFYSYSYSSESRLEEVYEMFNPTTTYLKVG
jgi:hypothetical protein